MHDKVGRRDALRLGAAALALGMTPLTLRRAAAADEALTIITPGGFGIDFMEAMNAVAGGYLAKQGFAPRLLGGNGQAAATNQVLGGQAKFTRASALDLFLAARDGAPGVIAIATLYQASTFHVISRSDKPIKDAADFAGKTIGVVSVRGTTELLLDLMLDNAGVAKDKVARVAVGNNPGALQLIDAGRIDAFIASISVVARLNADKAPILVWSTDRYAPLPSQCWVTTPAVIASEPDTIVRFLRALNGSCRDLMSANFDTVLARLTHDFDIPGADKPAELKAVKEAIIPLWLSQGEKNLLRNVPALWQAGGTAVQNAGLAKVGDSGRFYTNQFIDAALHG